MKTLKQFISIFLIIATSGASLPAFAEESKPPVSNGRVRCVSADKEVFSECLAAARALVMKHSVDIQAPAATIPAPPPAAPSSIWPTIAGVSIVAAIVGGVAAAYFATRKPEVRVHYDAPAGQ